MLQKRLNTNSLLSTLSMPGCSTNPRQGNSLLNNPLAMLLTSRTPLILRYPKHILWIQRKWTLEKSSLTSISSLVKSENPNHPKPPPSSSSKRRIEGLALSRTIYTSVNTWSRMPTHSPSFLPSSTNWNKPSTSPRWTCDGDTTTSISKREMNGRPHSSHPMVSMNL